MDRAALVPTQIFRDSRGHFREVLNITKSPWDSLKFIQQNVSINHQGVFRGFHYQLQHPQGKLITVLNGSVIDIVIDLRSDSPSFKQVSDFRLSSDKPETATLWVPACYAHAFYTLEDNTVFNYNVFGHAWHAGDEYSIDAFSIPQVRDFLSDRTVIMSDKDRNSLHIDLAPVYRPAE